MTRLYVLKFEYTLTTFLLKFEYTQTAKRETQLDTAASDRCHPNSLDERQASFSHLTKQPEI